MKVIEGFNCYGQRGMHTARTENIPVNSCYTFVSAGDSDCKSMMQRHKEVAIASSLIVKDSIFA